MKINIYNVCYNEFEIKRLNKKFVCPSCKEAVKLEKIQQRKEIKNFKVCKTCHEIYDKRKGKTIHIYPSYLKKKEVEKWTYTYLRCKAYNKRKGRTIHIYPSYLKKKEAEKWTYTCLRCSKVYDKRIEYTDHQGAISRNLCKSCSDGIKKDYVESFIWRVNRIKTKYIADTHISHSIEEEMRLKLKMSRNDIRIFGWNTGLISGEFIADEKQKWTYDHINGMVTIITSTAMEIIKGNLSTITEVVDYLDRVSCVVKTSQILNTTALKVLQIGKVTPEQYFDACDGIYTKDGAISKDEFIRDYSKYFIFEA